MDLKLIKEEKLIMEKKNKIAKEKRELEEIEKKIDNYGLGRGIYTSNNLKKFELKRLMSLLQKKFVKIDSEQLEKTVPKEKHEISFFRKIPSTNKFIKKITHKTRKNSQNFDSGQDSKNSSKGFKRNSFLKKNTCIDLKITQKFRNFGAKIVMNDIKNLNKETNEIIDSQKNKIRTFDIKMKCPKNKINIKLIDNKMNIQNIHQTPSDITFKLLSDEPIFKEKLLSENICGIRPKKNIKINYNSEESEEDSLFHNFCMSASNLKNIKIIDKHKNIQKDIKILRHISPSSNYIGSKKFTDRNDSFNNYKDDYLNLRKTIGEFKKFECEILAKKLNQNEAIKKNESLRNMNKEKSIRIKNSYFKILNEVNTAKQKDIESAIINPNIEHTFSKYFLPICEKALLTRIGGGIAAGKKKKKKFR
jgi:hypothetical protein